MWLWRLNRWRVRACVRCMHKMYIILLDTKRTGGSNTFTLPPSEASISTYVSSLANYGEVRERCQT